MPIDAMNGLSGELPPKVAPAGMLRWISASRAASGFSSKAVMRPLRSNRRIPMDEASDRVTGWAATVMSALWSMCASTSSQ